MFAAIREPLDYEDGFDVVVREETVAWRATFESAQEIATKIEESYEIPPAFNTLVHEIVAWRISGVAG
jgi:hypothetical protein